MKLTIKLKSNSIYKNDVNFKIITLNTAQLISNQMHPPRFLFLNLKAYNSRI